MVKKYLANFWVVSVLLVILICSCTPGTNDTLVLQTFPYGNYQGHAVKAFRLENNANGGIVVQLTNYGASVISIRTPDRQGNMGEITLGFDSLREYVNHPFHGPIVGRFANRIASGRFTLDSINYQLPLNNGPNHLHGGPGGFHTRVWKARPFESPDSIGIEFTYQSADGEEGYPGNLTTKVRYTLRHDNSLTLTMEAQTDAPTIVNLTNHSFFNLTGKGGSNILGHELQLFSDHFTPVDSTLIPTGEITPVAGSVMDFRQPKAINTNIDQVPGGFDHNFVLTDTTPGLKKAAILRDPASGRIMEVFTNQPGIQFYSGNFFDGSVIGRGSHTFPKYAGLCLEPQLFPDAPNHVNFPSARLAPGKTYRHITKYIFKTDNQ